MSMRSRCLLAALGALPLSALADSPLVVAQWQRFAITTAAQETRGAVDESIDLAVDLSPDASPGYSIDDVGGRRIARYRMGFNNIAEGWSWQPEIAIAGGDYYRYKFLPLGSTLEEHGERAGWGPLGGEFKAPVRWRFDYFAAFDNAHEFYPRDDDADGGFSVTLPEDARLPLRMEIRLRLVRPPTSESTTYWRAISGRPVEMTLKNRYFLGRLDSVSFLDASGRLLARHEPSPPLPAQNSARSRQ